MTGHFSRRARTSCPKQKIQTLQTTNQKQRKGDSMNFYPVDPITNGHPPKHPQESLDPLFQATLKVSWIIKMTQLLAELACAAAALAFYLSQRLYGNVPFYLDYLHFFIYLGQGILFVRKGQQWVAEWSDHKKPWWRLVIAVLGWPMHRSLVTFHQKVQRFDDQHPPHLMTMPWLRENLLFSLLGAFGAWFNGLWIALFILIVLDQGLGLF
jgi:hypothetical protein